MQNLCTQGPQTSAKEKEDMLRNSDNHRGTGVDLEELLKHKTFTRQVSGISLQDLSLKRPWFYHFA